MRVQTRPVFCLLLAAVSAVASAAHFSERRLEFEAGRVAPFARSRLFDCAAASDAARYDRASGKGAFAFALPYRADDRLRFVVAEFDSGRYVSGRMFVFGFEPKPLDGKAFEELREEFPMISVKEDADDVNPTAVLYPARRTPLVFVPTEQEAEHSQGISPARRLLGALAGSVARVGASTSTLAYGVTMEKDGVKVDLGVAKGVSEIAWKDVAKAVRSEIERRHPDRRGKVSERDVVDFRTGEAFRFDPSAAAGGGG